MYPSHPPRPATRRAPVLPILHLLFLHPERHHRRRPLQAHRRPLRPPTHRIRRSSSVASPSAHSPRRRSSECWLTCRVRCSVVIVAVGSCDLLQDARPPAIAPEQTTTRDQGARPSIHHISHTVRQRRVVRGFIPLHPCAGASRGRVAITHAHIHSLRRVSPCPKFRCNPFIKAFTRCRIVWLCRLLDTCFTLRSAKGGTV